MKEYFKSKYYITIFTIQAIALLCFCLSELWAFFTVFALVLEGVFFIVLGGHCFVDNRTADRNKDLYDMLPIEEEDKLKYGKKTIVNKKFNKIKGLIFIFFGIIIIFIVL